MIVSAIKVIKNLCQQSRKKTTKKSIMLTENKETRETLRKIVEEFHETLVETKTTKLAKARYSERLMRIAGWKSIYL